MEVQLELAEPAELTKLLVALAEGEIEFTLLKAERRSCGKSDKMDTVLKLHYPESLLTLLQLEGIEFLLVKAELMEVAPQFSCMLDTPPVTWITQPTIPLSPYIPEPLITPIDIIPNSPVTYPSTGDPLPWDWYKDTCATITVLAGDTEIGSSEVDLGNVSTVRGETFDNFTGKVLPTLEVAVN